MLFFSLTEEAKQGIKGVSSSSVSFEELHSGSVLSANDLWTEEEEWEGSLRGV